MNVQALGLHLIPCSSGGSTIPPAGGSIGRSSGSTRNTVRPSAHLPSVPADDLRKGSVFRVSPNELSFASATSWKAIYGPWPSRQATWRKSDFYAVFGAGFDSRCIGSEQDPAVHSRMKKSLSSAFSTKALLAQEGIIQRCVDAFVEKLRLRGGQPSGLDMTVWYDIFAFDVLGEMAFGESFECIELGQSYLIKISFLRSKHCFTAAFPGKDR